ncbi:MAG TPA: amino acid ABC transporter substrate-binding protein [Hyphomicrobiaceae bacterium]|nr:amino acid ABC transporter substrate-binding protein [Hyphomicrobiaceae bacterium]
MPNLLQLRAPGGAAASLLALAALTAALSAGPTLAQEPIKIGFSMALTGPLAPNGKQALLGMKIWEEETNAKGGLLGRPVKLIYYDDQSQPATVPGIYTKLIDVDKADLVLGGYATNMVAPAMPVIIQKKKTFMSLFALDVNAEFKYPNYFAVLPTGPRTKPAFTEGFFQVAMQQNPKPQTLALTAEDAEFSRNACEGARENAKEFGVTIVYDKSFPPGTTDFSPIVRAVQAANPDLVIVCSYPLSSVGMVLAINEANFKPKMIGGAMVGLQATVFKSKLGPKLNGIVNYETWVPSEKMMALAAEFFKTYQARAGAEGVDPLGYYLGGWGYAYISVLGEAITGAKSVDDAKIADYMRKTTFKTIMGEWSYGPGGEWTKSGMMQVQYHDIKEGAGLETWKGMSYQTVLTPPEIKTGEVIYPYEKAK